MQSVLVPVLKKRLNELEHQTFKSVIWFALNTCINVVRLHLLTHQNIFKWLVSLLELPLLSELQIVNFKLNSDEIEEKKMNYTPPTCKLFLCFLHLQLTRLRPRKNSQSCQPFLWQP